MSTLALAQDAPIKIGFLGDFEAVTKAYCQDSYLAAEIAVQEINAEGGLLGRPVVLIKKDGGNNPQKHHDLMTRLALEEDVVAVFGGASSKCLLMSSPASKEHRIPFLISVGNSQTVIADYGHPYVFMFQPNSWMETKAFSIFVTLMPWKRYAWIGPDYVWGREVFRFFSQHIEEVGAPIKWVAEEWHPLDNREFDGHILRILDARPDALLIASLGEDLRRFVIQAKTHGLFKKTAVFSLFYAGASDLMPEGIWTVSRAPTFYLLNRYPQAKTFINQFHDQFGRYPFGSAICTYDSFLAWRQAVLKANSVEPEAVTKALKGLSFTGLRGASHIREFDGQLDCPSFFGRMESMPGYPGVVMQSVVEIPAEKTWLSEKEVLARRKAAHQP